MHEDMRTHKYAHIHTEARIHTHIYTHIHSYSSLDELLTSHESLSSIAVPDGDLSQTILGFLEELLMAPCWESPEVYSLVMRVIHALLSDERTCQGMLEWFRRTTAQVGYCLLLVASVLLSRARA